MARYVDADALKERLEIISVVADNLYGMGINRGLDRAETEIDMLPTADVVEVVRCRDCQHYYDGRCYVGNRSPLFKYDVNIHHRKKDDFL